MGKLRWYKRDPKAALDGMLHMTLEETGAYSKMLDLLYTMDGQVPDDAAFIIRWLNCDRRVWKRLRARLIELDKLYVKGSYLRNYRVDRDVATALATLVAKSEAGRSGGSKTAHSNDLDEANAKLLENKNKKENQTKKETPLPPSEPQPSLLPPAEPPPSKYAWEGSIIRLTAEHFEKWQRMCPDLDLRLELQVRDDWLTSPEATKDHRDRWFITTSNHLGTRQRKAAAEKAEAAKSRSRHGEANRRRLAEEHATEAGLCPHSPEWMQFASQQMKGGLTNGQQHRAA